MTPQVDLPPSEYALSLRPYVMAVVLLQFLCLPGRFFDLLGGLCFLIVCILGYVVVWGKTLMASRWVMCWGMLCFMNAFFDTLFGAVRLMGLYHYGSPSSAGSKDGNGNVNNNQTRQMATMINGLPPWVYWWIVVTLIATPISEALGAFLSYKLYKDQCAREEGVFEAAYNGGGGANYGHYGADQGYGQGHGRPGQPGQYQTFQPHPPAQPSFTPFQGAGRTLNSTNI